MQRSYIFSLFVKELDSAYNTYVKILTTDNEKLLYDTIQALHIPYEDYYVRVV